jgi:hypothetical protein
MFRERKWRARLWGSVLLLLLLTPTLALAAQENPGMSKRLGDRAPIFSVPTSQGTLADYDRDYYGKHHLVLTFVPAAFTPV